MRPTILLRLKRILDQFVSPLSLGPAPKQVASQWRVQWRPVPGCQGRDPIPDVIRRGRPTEEAFEGYNIMGGFCDG